MSDIQRASKALSKSSNPATGVFSVRGATSSGRPAANPFSSFSGEPKRTSWDELSRERDPDGETKNYSVPPELIELARANRRGRGQVGTLTPLAPKPEQDVVVVVPAASPLALDIQPSSSAEPESSLQAPSVPLEGSSHDPDSARTAIQGKGNLELALAATLSTAEPPPAAATSPLAEMMRSELAAAAVESEVDSSESPSDRPASVRPSLRRSSRRQRRSLRIEMPVDTAAAARAAASAPTPRLHSYLAYATGAVLVGGYVALCYFANAMLAGLP